MTYGHLRADCMYTGISSGPNARYRVCESLYVYLYTVADDTYIIVALTRAKLTSGYEFTRVCSFVSPRRTTEQVTDEFREIFEKADV